MSETAENNVTAAVIDRAAQETADAAASDERANADRDRLAAALERKKLGSGGGPALAPIGGQYISSIGGLVGFAPFGCATADGVVNSLTAIGASPSQFFEFGVNAGVPVPPTPSQTNYMDCARWRANFQPFVDDTTHTGSWAQGVDIIMHGCAFELEIINDKRFTPAILAKYGLINPAAGGLSGNLGCRMTCIQGNAANYPALDVLDGAVTVPDFYYCPSVKLANPNTVIDALGKKMVRSLPLVLLCNAPVFHLPYEWNRLQNFRTHCINRYLGW